MSKKYLSAPLTKTLLVVCLSLALGAQSANACTRAMYVGPDGVVVTGRNMDWSENMDANLWSIPRGTAHDGAAGKNSIKWVSKYGSVVATAYDIAAADGMNEKGLAANLLYLAETDFGPIPENNKPRLSFCGWTQYVLSNYATVEEVVKAFINDPLYIVPINFGPGKQAHPTVHMSISDPTGNSAIIEYIKGKPVIHQGREHQVMTNSPTYDEQLTLNNYWKKQDGTKVLPGSHQSEDRFVRASYYLAKLPETKDPRQAVAGVFSVMRNVSVPWGKPDEKHPNIAPTYWRTVLDQKNLRYYFESTLSPNIVWADLNKIDFSPKSGIRNLKVEGNDEIIGNINKDFKATKNFPFLAP